MARGWRSGSISWRATLSDSGIGRAPDLRRRWRSHLRLARGRIDDAVARWDRSHLHDFTLTEGTTLTTPSEAGRRPVPPSTIGGQGSAGRKLRAFVSYVDRGRRCPREG